MSEIKLHTPEPWGDSSHRYMTTPGAKRRRITMSETDFKRAVACVNACAGIPTEELERRAAVEQNIADRDREIVRLKEQVKQLLAERAKSVDRAGRDPLVYCCCGECTQYSDVRLSQTALAEQQAQRRPLTESELRSAFERWFSNEGEFPPAVERIGAGYKLAAAQAAWMAWQAAVSVHGIGEQAQPDDQWKDLSDEQRAWCVLYERLSGIEPQNISAENFCEDAAYQLTWLDDNHLETVSSLERRLDAIREQAQREDV